jgi:hypothetical protein
MKTARLFQTSAVISLLLCSCATDRPGHQQLPTEVSFNRGAGRGDFLFVTLRLKESGDLLFAVDTGEPDTILDTSLESKLGKCFYTNQIHYVWYAPSQTHIYRAPRLFLGNARLTQGDWVKTDDLSRLFSASGRKNNSRGLSGVLGMDCLQHYCVQLDFAAGKMRFLDSGHLKTENLGDAYTLTISNRAGSCRAYVDQTLAGVKGARSWIDTGDPNDGSLARPLFEQELQNQKGSRHFTFKDPAGDSLMLAEFPKGVFGGENYTNLHVLENPADNIIGLRFLARHLVTFNLPKRMMYLKQERAGPLELDSNQR